MTFLHHIYISAALTHILQFNNDTTSLHCSNLIEMYKLTRVRTRISFSFATIFANLIFFVPFSLTLSQILSQILAIFRQRIIVSEKRCSFTDSFNCSNRFRSQYNVKCVGDLKVILALIFKTFAVIN